MKVFARILDKGEKTRPFHVVDINSLQDARDMLAVIKNHGGVYIGRLGRRTSELSVSFFTTANDELAIELIIDADKARKNRGG